jgi:hypothetical protein
MRRAFPDDDGGGAARDRGARQLTPPVFLTNSRSLRRPAVVTAGTHIEAYRGDHYDRGRALSEVSFAELTHTALIALIKNLAIYQQLKTWASTALVMFTGPLREERVVRSEARQ